MVTLQVTHEAIIKGYVGRYAGGKCIGETFQRLDDGTKELVPLGVLFQSRDEAIDAVIKAHDALLKGSTDER